MTGRRVRDTHEAAGRRHETSRHMQTHYPTHTGRRHGRHGKPARIRAGRGALLTILLTLLAVALRAAPGSAGDPARQKARYYYMQGVIHDVNGKQPQAYEYYKKASMLDSSYVEAGSAFGGMRIGMPTPVAQAESIHWSSMDLMRRFVDRYPGDYFESEYYAYLAAQLDSLPEALRVFERLYSIYPDRTELLAHLAETYAKADDTQKAIEAWDAYDRIEGPSAETALQKSLLKLYALDTAGAVRQIDALIATNPRSSEYVLLKGSIYQAVNKPDSALKYLTACETLAPESGLPKMALASLYKSMGDSVNYDRKTYEALLSDDIDLGRKAGVLSEYLQTLLNDKNDHRRGDYLFDVLYNQYPHEPMLLDLAARYNAAKGDRRAAIESISAAIDLAPDELAYRTQLMMYNLADDNAQGATDAYRAMDGYVLPDEYTRLLYATAAQAAGDHAAADSTLNGLLRQIAPTLTITDTVADGINLRHLDQTQLQQISTIYEQAGDNFHSRGDTARSYAAFEMSLKFNPDNSMVLNNYAYFLATGGGDLDKAAQMSARSLDADPDNPTLLDTYAWILFKQGKYEEALEYERQALEKYTDEPDVEILSHMGDILFMAGKPDEALEYWRRALDASPDDELLRRKVTHKTFFYK